MPSSVDPGDLRFGLRSSGPVDVSTNEIMGNIGEVEGRDVVIVDELIDTGGTLGTLPRKLQKAGAKARQMMIFDALLLFFRSSVDVPSQKIC